MSTISTTSWLLKSNPLFQYVLYTIKEQYSVHQKAQLLWCYRNCQVISHFSNAGNSYIAQSFHIVYHFFFNALYNVFATVSSWSSMDLHMNNINVMNIKKLNVMYLMSKQLSQVLPPLQWHSLLNYWSLCVFVDCS